MCRIVRCVEVSGMSGSWSLVVNGFLYFCHLLLRFGEFAHQIILRKCKVSGDGLICRGMVACDEVNRTAEILWVTKRIAHMALSRGNVAKAYFFAKLTAFFKKAGITYAGILC